MAEQICRNAVAVVAIDQTMDGFVANLERRRGADNISIAISGGDHLELLGN
jgi:hypothetical protein